VPDASTRYPPNLSIPLSNINLLHQIPNDENIPPFSRGNLEESSPPKAPLTKGKRKIPIKYIDDKPKRAVTFSKRRAGLQKKVRELVLSLEG